MSSHLKSTHFLDLCQECQGASKLKCPAPYDAGIAMRSAALLSKVGWTLVHCQTPTWRDEIFGMHLVLAWFYVPCKVGEKSASTVQHYYCPHASYIYNLLTAMIPACMKIYLPLLFCL